ncbi:MAG: DUF1800 domain-containing protein [Anaerolineales bacterium]
MNRRHFLQLASLVAASSALQACAPAYRRIAGEPRPLTEWPDNDAATFAALNRLTFGPRADERQRAAEIGMPAWIEEQLAPNRLDDGSADFLLSGFRTLKMKATELHDWSDKLFDDVDWTTVPNELRRATLLRQVYSKRQLYEVMVEFWTDHFNISTAKGDCFYLKTVDDREVIRPHALGRFRDLLWASAHSPAMLVYLDQYVSDKTHPNENYAREVMELHTLGVEGGYSQSDVMELARCFTGWTMKEHWWRGEFMFNIDAHDTSPKTVLGMTIEPSGQAEAEHILDVLAVHPSTARFITHKLAQRFLGSQPPADIVQRATQTFTDTAGDIGAVLHVILLDGVTAGITQPKFKRPVNFITSALRQLNAATDSGAPLHEVLTRMGQAAFTWPTPDGFPDRTEVWQSNLLPRWKFALALAQNEVEGTEINFDEVLTTAGATTPQAMTDRLAGLLLGAPLPAPERDALLAALHNAGDANIADELPRVLTAGLLASPAFQWR